MPNSFRWAIAPPPYRICRQKQQSLQQLGTAAKRIGAELLLDLINGVAELFLFVRRSEQLELLRIAAVTMEVSRGYTDEPDFLIQRKLGKQFTGDRGDFFAGLD